jgi:prepilin-type N-terminal cleavage/methylation domain-containing protein/prepilin-type processing-associated H-X9-DG protein
MEYMFSIEKRKKKGFTLIELLVVIAIIAVLVAMLLPALSKARDQARTVACLANYHQFAIATRAYMDENQDWLPQPVSFYPTEQHWTDQLNLYLKSGSGNTVFQDPAAAAAGETHPAWGYKIGGYGMNSFWIDVDRKAHSFYENRDYPPSIVEEPSKEVVFGDNRGMWNVGPLLDIYPYSIHPDFWGGGNGADAASCRMATRHSRSPNMMFLDLHAEHISFSLAKEWSEYWLTRPWWGPPSCWRPDWN